MLLEVRPEPNLYKPTLYYRQFVYLSMLAMTKIVGSRIKKKRVELGYTQEQLALLLGCSYQLIQHYEKGAAAMPIYTLQAFAHACWLPVDWFFMSEYEILVNIQLLK
jgi:DNA-binding XRE family transcriptional regulator